MARTDDCRSCDHPASHHEAGECWTDSQDREIWGGTDQCKCSWYEPRRGGDA